MKSNRHCISSVQRPYIQLLKPQFNPNNISHYHPIQHTHAPSYVNLSWCLFLRIISKTRRKRMGNQEVTHRCLQSRENEIQSLILYILYIGYVCTYSLPNLTKLNAHHKDGTGVMNDSAVLLCNFSSCSAVPPHSVQSRCTHPTGGRGVN